ncbi:MAG: hypothetical protein C0404_01100 [Verrucomicrobia bacterium]|nr:hypothetical protein [Verrucomicrobiota bacterium]
MVAGLMRDRKINALWLFQFLADIAAICAAYYTTFYLRFHSEFGAGLFAVLNSALEVHTSGPVGGSFEEFYLTSAIRILLIMGAVICVLYALFNLYPDRRFIKKRPYAWHVLLANAVALMLFYTYFYLSRNVFHPRSFFVTVVVLNVIYCVIFREAVDLLLVWLRRRWGLDRWNVLLIGDNSEADYIQEILRNIHPHGFEVTRRMVFDGGKTFDQLVREIESEIEKGRPDVIIAAEKQMTVPQIMRIMEVADKRDLPLKVLSDKLNVIVSNAKMPADMIQGMPLVHFEQPAKGRRFEELRRVYSVIIGGVAFAVLLPLMGLIALLTRLTSRGPALFVQERIGVNRKPFTMYKFRTMYEGSNELQAQVEEFNESGAGLFKIRNDPRVTPLGRLLRRFSLDELPQLLNVVRGEMFIVGPRPLPRRDFENYYEEWHYSRHSGIPGLTCLWQVSGRSDLNFESMCILDVYYLRNRNWILDLKVVLRTVWVVLFAKGAY